MCVCVCRDRERLIVAQSDTFFNESVPQTAAVPRSPKTIIEVNRVATRGHSEITVYRAVCVVCVLSRTFKIDRS